MEIIKTKKALNDYLSGFRQSKGQIGFVPTMGALHAGHLSLIGHVSPLVDTVVCSIFVNPTQFNDPEDLRKYPRPIEEDIRLLTRVKCDVLFLPAVAEMYGKKEDWYLDLGHLDTVLEAKHRPGHFQGVTQIVKKLFDAVRPDVACFGQKDFQQFMVIQYMVDKLDIPVKLERCPTLREPDGLAMSSRNIRLSDTGRRQALALYQTLREVKKGVDSKPVSTLKKTAIERLNASEGVQLEYFDICSTADLTAVDDAGNGAGLVALVAAWVDGVRLIDNMILR